MVEYIYAPLLVMAITGMILPLVDLAETTNEKVMNHTSDMVDAVDCAFLGLDLSECSPNLLKHTPTENLIEYNNKVEQIIEQNK